MKKLTFLPILLLSLVLSGCHLVDDDIDLPVPEEPAKDQIQGTWFNSSIIARSHDYAAPDMLGDLLDERVYSLNRDENTRYYVIDERYINVGDPDPSEDFSAEYTLIDSAGATYVRFLDPEHMNEPETYEITRLTDSAMTWKREYLVNKHPREDRWTKHVTIQEYTRED